jgi:hypothetical protein
MSKYPIIIEQSIYQYDEHVFVWFDETGGVGGASNYLDEARRELNSYATHMNMLSLLKEKEKLSRIMLENTESLYHN